MLLIPAAYFPSFYQATHSTDVVAFLTDYLVAQQWPVGPPWFIWLLLALDGVTVLIATLQPTAFLIAGQWLIRLRKQPIWFGLVLYSMVALSLIPLSLWIGHYTWVGRWGPFDVQLNRLLFYRLFFLLGSSLGAVDWQRILFSQGRFLNRGWLFWLILSITSYTLVIWESGFGAEQIRQGRLTPAQGYFLYDLTFVASCLMSVCACLSYFKRFMSRPAEVWTSLSANAYGIYCIHYGFVTGFNLPFYKPTGQSSANLG
ncbi:hypothetical protein [Spirosoma fluminis]